MIILALELDPAGPTRKSDTRILGGPAIQTSGVPRQRSIRRVFNAVQYWFDKSYFATCMTANLIELRHLRHFVALSEELHFGRAAKRCNISQPPFSVSIQQLEENLGLSLVLRSTHEVRLTPAGAAYYEEACKVLSQLERGYLTAARYSQGLQGTLAVGSTASMLHRGLERAVELFEAQHPDVAVNLFELSTPDQISGLLRHRIQYGFIHSPVLPEAIESQELLREPFVLAVPSRHPAAAGKTDAEVSLALFSQEPFVLFSRHYSPTYYDQVIALCLSSGFSPNIRHEARHWLTVLTCVSKGMGISLVPRCLTNAGYPNVIFLSLPTNPIESFIRGAWLRSEDAQPALTAWRQVVREVVHA